MSIAEEKRLLRGICRARAQDISPAKKEAQDSARTKIFLASELYRACENLFCFVSMTSEPDTTELLRAALRQGKHVAVPRTFPHREMAFFWLSPRLALSEQLFPGAYGIREPVGDLLLAEPNPHEKNLCLVPGLAFDRTGGRLGRGGGYYDRYLAKYPFLCKIGLTCHSCVVEHVPVDRIDCSVDGILTEDALEVWRGGQFDGGNG